MILFPDCKINLGLRILRKRNDGYHDIETVMFPIGLCDILELVPSPDGETKIFTSGNYIDCPPEKNLVMKAYNAVRDLVPDLPATHIYLHKVIPDGAGLGGGSSDAAYTVKGLNELWELGLDMDKMMEIVSGVGADCPFFIADEPALAVGTGTTLSHIESPLPEGSIIVLAKPDRCVSTKEAYAGVIPSDAGPSIKDVIKLPVSHWQGVLVNDFEESVISKVPEIGEIKDTLLESGAEYASMSGSGSSVFGIFAAEKQKMAETVASVLGKKYRCEMLKV